VIAMYLLAAHMSGDYLFQSAWMAANKLTNAWIRAVHVLVYTGCFLPIALIYLGLHGLLFLYLLAVFHFITDSHRWRTSNPWPAMPILQDQSLHILQIAILGAIFLT
jgi:hypothetical protein